MGRIVTFNEATNEWEFMATEPALFEDDIEITTKELGIILKSPDGTRWRVNIDNTGTLITTAL
ncbi:MAG: hypothetical protein ACK5XN_36585 [Bacteroidota bacterium]|jgi:hypothetical protein